MKDDTRVLPDTSVVTVRQVGDDLPQSVYHTATVTVKDAVDGTKQRRRRSAAAADGPPSPAVHTHIKVDPTPYPNSLGEKPMSVWQVAQAICMTSQRLIIKSETEVWVVNR